MLHLLVYPAVFLAGTAVGFAFRGKEVRALQTAKSELERLKLQAQTGAVKVAKKL